MSKPTLFFSHSSKDKDMILAIKNKVMQYTSGTLEIFQSSDGESIPFGTNWIHKVEEGLKEAKVMFVFVTEKSISTGWIYFEGPDVKFCVSVFRQSQEWRWKTGRILAWIP